MNTTSDDCWKVGGVNVPFELATLYADARQRVLSSRRLRDFYDEIMGSEKASGNDYLVWVLSARVGDIVKEMRKPYGAASLGLTATAKRKELEQ